MVAASIVLLVAASVVQGEGVGHSLPDLLWVVLLATISIVGALVASAQPRNPIGWIMCGLTAFAAVATGVEAYLKWAGSDEAAAWLGNWTWIPLVVVPSVFLPLFFPDGRLPSRRWRAVPWCAGIGTTAFAFSEAFGAGPLSGDPDVINPYGIDHIAVDVVSFGAFLVLGAIVATIASVVVRFRRSSGDERQQMKWLIFALSFALSTLLVGWPLSAAFGNDVADAFVLLGVLGIPVAIGIAILRYRLYDIDLLINRTLVYSGLTAGVVALYVAIVGGLSTVLREGAGFWIALVATGIVALLVQPLRSALQRRVNRLTFGASEAQPPTRGLRGRLHEAFVPEAAELQRARERLVAAREEERRRLRRDLHDGLGPTLAGAALKVEAAENLLASDPGAAEGLLEDARSEIQSAVADVRRLVYALRPPALDELGLVGALREQGERLEVGEHVRIEVDAPEHIDGLPAAVEVAAYRIALEAMTNVARHAHAHICRVRISVNGALELEISDDGHGLPSHYRAGVGLASMHERADELGGTCEVERIDGSGTRVRARLPLGSA